jgi:hypothetical protein
MNMNNVPRTARAVKGGRVRCVLVEGGGPLLLVVSTNHAGDLDGEDAPSGTPVGSVTADNARRQVNALATVWPLC